MKFDMLSAVYLTAIAVFIIAILTANFGSTTASRTRIATGLFAWFVLVTGLAVTGSLGYPNGLGAPGLGLTVAVSMIVVITQVLRSASLRKALQDIPLGTLIGVHTVRILGIVFVILYDAGRLPAPFAPIAGWGDIVSGIVAAPLALLAYRHATTARAAIWLWNGFGLLDLVAAIGIGAVSAPGPLQIIHANPPMTIITDLPWLIIPAFLVPILACIHLGIFYRLRSWR